MGDTNDTVKKFIDNVAHNEPEAASLLEKIAPLLERRDGPAALLEDLPRRFPPQEVAEPAPQRAWELAGVFYRNAGRLHEALAIFWALYQQMLAAQDGGVRVHKGMPLVWMSDCYARLGFRVHAKRFLMLTLCEDALLERGSVSPDTSGVYFRLVWQHGLRDTELRRYMSEVWQVSQESPAISGFPEALLQRIDNAWLTELPSPDEALVYLVNQRYVRSLLADLGDSTGEHMELLIAQSAPPTQ